MIMKRPSIKTEQEYLAALDRVGHLMDAPPDSAEERELERLSAAVERYEKSGYADEEPDPIEVIRLYMDQQGLTRSDLELYLGSPSRVSEVLAGKRELSKTMIRNLAKGLDIPSDLLLGIRPARVFEVREPKGKARLGEREKSDEWTSGKGNRGQAAAHLQRPLIQVRRPSVLVRVHPCQVRLVSEPVRRAARRFRPHGETVQ